MNVSATKIEIIKELLKTDSVVMLRHVDAVLKNYKADLWNGLNSAQQHSVQKAKKQLSKGMGRTHEQVMKKYK